MRTCVHNINCVVCLYNYTNYCASVYAVCMCMCTYWFVLSISPTVFFSFRLMAGGTMVKFIYSISLLTEMMRCPFGW